MTLTLMYATDFYDQLEHRIIPALRSDFVVLADRYFYTLIARAGARGIQRDYLNGLYEMALRPDLTFWLMCARKSRSSVNFANRTPSAIGNPDGISRFRMICFSPSFCTGKNKKRI